MGRERAIVPVEIAKWQWDFDFRGEGDGRTDVRRRFSARFRTHFRFQVGFVRKSNEGANVTDKNSGS